METCHLPNDVPGRIEIHFDSEDDEEDIPLSILKERCSKQPPSKKPKLAECVPEWTKDNIPIDLNMVETDGYKDCLNNVKSALQNRDPVEIFENLFDNEIVSHIVYQTNFDQAVNNYRISIQGKKWWWPLFTHMVNV